MEMLPDVEARRGVSPARQVEWRACHGRTDSRQSALSFTTARRQAGMKDSLSISVPARGRDLEFMANSRNACGPVSRTEKLD